MKYLQKRNRFHSIYCYRINIRERIWQLDGGWHRASGTKWHTRTALYLFSTGRVYRVHTDWHRTSGASALLLVVGHNRFRTGHRSQCIDSRVNRNKRNRCNGPGMIYATEACCYLKSCTNLGLFKLLQIFGNKNASEQYYLSRKLL